MKRKVGVRKKKAVKKKGKDYSVLRKAFSLVGICLAKFSCLVAVLVVTSFLFVYLYECLVKSPYFSLDEIVVSGLDGDLQEEILEDCGLQEEVSLLSLNLNELKEKIERHPWIRRVEIEKRFPHSLVIHAEREVPRALVVGDGLYYMNRWGEIFARAGEGGNLDYPLITGVRRGEKEEMERLACAAGILRCFEKQESPWSLKELSEVHVGRNGIVSLYFSSLPMVIKVRGGELERRLGDLKRLVRHLKGSGRIHMVKGINLNYRDAAVVTMKKG
ncbi:MAG: FtsQ-type POTRA domain-containing protein [Deltaproteobacteria bacterium]|nr:FtsQ-type POTRA domain-containing protein [Deltaproteobacteria bacterium]MBW2016715.1 FtsQ-type POTRA domain-containing protein [Deltaproteobacteria bacterium]MBW2129139.1 FtsQ-type POTRA domain-containing protein [Deltaproteobacteria bacterium]MBW2302457.1 FtsQ-type POTRA domain-containing protein [Deltaproteobacteria bacterium]